MPWYYDMQKRTLILLYSSVPLVAGLLTFLLAVSFGDIPSFSTLDGADAFTFTLKLMGGTLGVLGLSGIGWAFGLTENPELPGYAGLTWNGLLVVVGPIFLVGPFWMLVAWIVWLVPTFRARPLR